MNNVFLCLKQQTVFLFVQSINKMRRHVSVSVYLGLVYAVHTVQVLMRIISAHLINIYLIVHI